MMANQAKRSSSHGIVADGSDSSGDANGDADQPTQCVPMSVCLRILYTYNTYMYGIHSLGLLVWSVSMPLLAYLLLLCEPNLCVCAFFHILILFIYRNIYFGGWNGAR